MTIFLFLFFFSFSFYFYLNYQIYKPDIEGSSDAVCDYVFNETVLAYSHDNIRSFSHMFSDYLNVQSLLWLSNTSTHSRAVTFLNIDSFRMQPFFGDQPNEYFSHYKNIFKRIVRAIDFGSRKVCFKHLIMQPKPEILFTMDGWRHDLRCANIGPSSLYQRWNLQMRKDRGLLIPDTIHTQNAFTILLIKKASRIGSRVRTSPSKSSKIVPIPFSIPIDRDSTPDNSPSALGISNSEEITTMLEIMSKDIANNNKNKNKGLRFEIVQQDFDLLSFDEQILLVAKSSIIVGMHGTGIALSMHMPVGAKYCCGLIEIFPFIREKDNRGTSDSPHATVSSTQKNTKGHSNMAKRMGLKYTRVDLTGQGQERSTTTHPEPNILGPMGANSSSTQFKSPKVIRTLRDINSGMDRKHAHTGMHPVAPSPPHTLSKGIHIPFDSLNISVSTMIASILSEESCLLPAVVLESL